MAMDAENASSEISHGLCVNRRHSQNVVVNSNVSFRLGRASRIPPTMFHGLALNSDSMLPQFHPPIESSQSDSGRLNQPS